MPRLNIRQRRKTKIYFKYKGVYYSMNPAQAILFLEILMSGGANIENYGRKVKPTFEMHARARDITDWTVDNFHSHYQILFYDYKLTKNERR